MDIKNQNELKYNNYKEQFGRLKKALTNGFNLEAVFIEYSIMEDRTESILRHSEKWDAYIKSRKGRDVTIDSKIRYIQKLAECKSDLLHKYFSDLLLLDILTWKTERNRLIHALLKQDFKGSDISQIAEKGRMLAYSLRDKSGLYNRAIKRKTKKTNILS